MKLVRVETVIPTIILTTVYIITRVSGSSIVTAQEESSSNHVSSFDKYALIHKQLAEEDSYVVDIETVAVEDIYSIAKDYESTAPEPTLENMKKYIIADKPFEQQVIRNYAYTDSYKYTLPSDIKTVTDQLQYVGISYGGEAYKLNSISQYDEIIERVIERHQQTCKYQIPYNLVKAVILAESGGNPDAFNGAARGLMQIEYTNIDSFVNYGRNTYGEEWNAEDLYDPAKNIDYGVYVLAGNLNYYKGDYLKSVQAYNYSFYSLDKLISKYGNSWLENRIHMAELNNCSSYGDPRYVENVFKFYI